MTVVANMCTYPPRRAGLKRAVAQIAAQVDRLNLVLNQYDNTLEELSEISNLNQIIPTEDTKDAGKFYPDVSDATFVLFVDDDIDYPDDFVARTVSLFKRYGRGHFCGYHGSLYQSRWDYLKNRRLRRAITYDSERIADYRKVFYFAKGQQEPIVVDQIATCAAIIHAGDMPPYSFMKTSQRFVDVRLARWCFEKNIKPISLPRSAGWLKQIAYEETIHRDFTATNPPNVTAEILTFAFKVAERGQIPEAASGAEN